MSDPSSPARAGSPRRRLVIGLTAAAVLLIASGVVAFAATRPTGTPAAAPSPSWSSVFGEHPLPTADPNGESGCQQLNTHYGQADFQDPDVIEPIALVLEVSTDSTLKTQAKALVGKAKDARAAKGAPDELTATLGMSRAATELLTYCTRRGFVKP